MEVQVADLGETVGKEAGGEVEEDGHVLDEEGRARIKGCDGFGIDLSTCEEKRKPVGGIGLECHVNQQSRLDRLETEAGDERQGRIE